jgi:lipopolysaccharide export system protein LptA
MNWKLKIKNGSRGRSPHQWIFILAAFAIYFTGCKKSDTVDADAQVTAGQKNPFKSGADAQPMDGGLLAIAQLKLEMFATNGQPQITATAPDCIYDSAGRTANSAGKLFLQNGDGKIRAEGEGFLWRQNESSLTISNNVKTFIASMALAAATGLNAQTNSSSATNETLISSRVADFDLNARHAIYSGDVHVTDPQMKLTCEWLIADLPQSGRVNHIVAETNVVIDFTQNNETTHATGEKAVYNFAVENGATNETVTLTGNPQVDGVRGGMTYTNWADTIIWNRADNGIRMINQHISILRPEKTAQTNLPPGTIKNIDDIKIQNNTP